MSAQTIHISPMFSLESFKIDLKGLKTDVTTFEYDLGDAYFSAIGGSEVSGGDVLVRLDVRRSSAYFELDFSISGNVTVVCDLCLDDMEQPIETQNHIVAKFGDECSEDEDLVAWMRAKASSTWRGSYTNSLLLPFPSDTCMHLANVILS